jgi:hypothetical protein
MTTCGGSTALDYWTRSGRLTNHQHAGYGGIIVPTDRRRSGYLACWPPDQVELCERMFKLIELGFTFDAACRLANDWEQLYATLEDLQSIWVREPVA